jgi:membrane protein implicated in regulation of membrane protease activity
MDWFRDHLWETWLLIAVALGVLELMSTDLILIMLAGGALVGMVVALLGVPAGAQIVVALATALGLLALLRPPMVQRLHSGPTLRTGAEALIGQRGHVLEPLSHMTAGRVKIGGEVWTAKPYDEDDQIETGAAVDVVSIKGATAYVLRTHQLGS